MLWIEQLFAVFFVLLLLAAALWALRRRQGQPLWPPFSGRNEEQALLRSVDRLPLTPQHCLHVVRFAGREVLVATHPGGVTIEDGGAGFRRHFEAEISEGGSK